jgi:acetylornithine/N-succinyldiaminopimelate aminotransferase
MTSQETIALGQANILPTYKRFPIAIDHGKGCRLYDPEGNEYLDFTSGIGVASLGYGDPAWVSAVSEQAARLAHVSNLFHTEPPARLAAELVRRTGMSGVFFANGGGEANEGLIKCARKYSHDRYGDGRATVVSLVQSFHGRTVTTLAATGVLAIF